MPGVQPAANNSDRYEPAIPLKEWAEVAWEDDTEPPIAYIVANAFDEISGEFKNVEERFLNRLFAYYKSMQEFTTEPPEEVGSKKMVSNEWLEGTGQRDVVTGHLRGGVPHGMGRTSSCRKSYLYVGTFVNGKFHGYGLLFIPHAESYYEGEFRDGHFHGQGLHYNPKDEGIGRAKREGQWEYGSFVPPLLKEDIR